MGTAQLGNFTFRLDPSQIQYATQIDFTTIDTLGGQVVQILGSTTGDITIAGTFGQDHPGKRESWQMAETFHATIRAMMDQQTVTPKTVGTAIHQPIQFTYLDGVHNWNMKVLIKGITDLTGNGAIEHSNGKFSYGYVLTLFLVEDQSLLLSRITTDKFISRISSGIGWKANAYNGMASMQDAKDFITAHSTDGTYQGYLAALLQGTNTIPDPGTATNAEGP